MYHFYYFVVSFWVIQGKMYYQYIKVAVMGFTKMYSK